MSAQKDRDQRQSFRCPVRGPSECVLEVGGATIPGQLVDESAGGFSVLVENPPESAIDQPARLRTDAGWFPVRIIHIQQQEVSIDNEDAGSEESPSKKCCRLGLCRLGDIMPWEQPRASWTFRCPWFQLGQWQSSSAIFTLLFGIALAFAVVGLSLLMKNEHVMSSILGSKYVQPSPLSSRAARTDPSRREAERPSADASNSVKKRPVLSDLPGATPFQSPDVVTLLELTEQQIEQIKKIVEATYEAIEKLVQQSQGLSRGKISQEREELLQQARRQALGILTDQQRAKWKAFVEGN